MEAVLSVMARLAFLTLVDTVDWHLDACVFGAGGGERGDAAGAVGAGGAAERVERAGALAGAAAAQGAQGRAAGRHLQLTRHPQCVLINIHIHIGCRLL